MLGLLGEATAITWADLSSVFSEITGQFTIANMVGVLKGAFGIAILFVFFWFGIKKGSCYRQSFHQQWYDGVWRC